MGSSSLLGSWRRKSWALLYYTRALVFRQLMNDNVPSLIFFFLFLLPIFSLLHAFARFCYHFLVSEPANLGLLLGIFLSSSCLALMMYNINFNKQWMNIKLKSTLELSKLLSLTSQFKVHKETQERSIGQLKELITGLSVQVMQLTSQPGDGGNN